MSLETFEPMKYGPIGEAVAEAEPHTEADPVGIYASVLALWSSAIGGHVLMDNGRPVFVWTVLAGGSAIGRKGTALKVARSILKPAIGAFLDSRTAGGVSSGPSLTQLLYERQEETDGTEQGTDTRTLIIDEEWSENLKRQNRCPTFASKLRSCWDGVTIRHTTTKVSMTVGEPRLGFHAHITPGEWSEYVKPRDAQGGSFNRLLPVMVEGSKILPYGHKEHFPEIQGLADAYDWARKSPRRMSLSKDAGRRFDELRVMFLHKMLDMPDHLRCYVERTPEQIIRVAAVLTAAECRTTINRAAVNAAWAFVQYSMRSVERLVRAETEARTSRTTKSLPELVREILDRYEGEATSTLMLRSLGMRATAASLRAAVESMDDVEVIKGSSATGKGRRPVLYRRVESTEAPETEPEETEVQASTVPVQASTDTLEPPKAETRELTFSGDWL